MLLAKEMRFELALERPVGFIHRQLRKERVSGGSIIMSKDGGDGKVCGWFGSVRILRCLP